MIVSVCGLEEGYIAVWGGVWGGVCGSKLARKGDVVRIFNPFPLPLEWWLLSTSIRQE
jgi:hypothetical protein